MNFVGLMRKVKKNLSYARMKISHGMRKVFMVLIFMVLVFMVFIGAVSLKSSLEKKDYEELKDTANEKPASSEKKPYYELIYTAIENNELLKKSQNVTFYGITFYLKPFVEDDELNELAKVLANVSNDIALERDYANTYIHCYSSVVGIDLTKKSDKDKILSEIKSLVDEQEKKAKIDMDSFRDKLLTLPNLKQSLTGEWYYIIRDYAFAEDCKKMANEFETIHKLNPLEMTEARGNSYEHTANFSDCVGYTGDGFSVYKNSYSSDNKVSEGLFIHIPDYQEVFCKMVYDYTKIRPDSDNVDFTTRIDFYDGELTLNIDWREYEEYLSVEKLSALTYRLYEEIR